MVSSTACHEIVDWKTSVSIGHLHCIPNILKPGFFLFAVASPPSRYSLGWPAIHSALADLNISEVYSTYLARRVRKLDNPSPDSLGLSPYVGLRSQTALSLRPSSRVSVISIDRTHAEMSEVR